MSKAKLPSLKRTPEVQEYYTPYYAVRPLLKYISKDMTIWCPFDKEWSAFYQTFKAEGYNVIRSHIDENGGDFFSYTPLMQNVDIIISNPPYNLKDEVFKRLYELNKPYAMLMPLNTLQGKKRFQYIQDIQLLAFNDRIWFHGVGDMESPTTRPAFATAYFCKRLLPKDLILEYLDKFDKPLNSPMAND